MSLLLGHRFPSITTLIMPCPLIVFTITLLSASISKVDVKIYILLLIWAFTGLPKVFMFNVSEDYILLFSGIYGLVVLIKKYKDGCHNT